jgi:ribonuclease P protein component
VQARLGGAVVRNRIKRRVREILRQHRPKKPRARDASEAIGWDVVVQPLSAEVAAADFAALSEELTRLVETSLNR